ncbi:zinc-ribbon domain-containing protein [Candidatus Clostridium radicumherbarum]|uniref:Zinc-ribbon domain-containing protein n=1 Tax=Candidatus Clostridium radicumherbarum TaxID=3381662 RepID=A0ABW8TWE8_9CLOT
MAFKDNLFKIGKCLEDGVSNVAYKSENLIEISKLNMSVSSNEKHIDEIYLKIGKKIYKEYADDKVSDSSLIEKCKEIDSINKDIESIKKKILKLKNRKLCKKCGAAMEKEDEFCPKCGKQQ